jgi:hypothetical protein
MELIKKLFEKEVFQMLYNLSLRAILTGISFGIWPLLMNRSGLSGNISSFVLVVVMLVCILPLSVGRLGSIFNPDVKLLFAIGASVFGAAGIVLLNSILARSTPQDVGLLLVLTFVVQIAVPSVYHVVVTGGLTVSQGTGFALAIAAAILLNL